MPVSTGGRPAGDLNVLAPARLKLSWQRSRPDARGRSQVEIESSKRRASESWHACQSSTGSCCSPPRRASAPRSSSRRRRRGERLVDRVGGGAPLTAEGEERVMAGRNERERLIAASELAAQAEHVARGVVEYRAGGGPRRRGGARGGRSGAARGRTRLRRRPRGAARTEWLIEQRRAAPQQGPLAVRKAQLEGELAAERRQAERVAREQAERLARVERLRAQHAADSALVPLAERLRVAEDARGEAVAGAGGGARGGAATRSRGGRGRWPASCAPAPGEEAEIQARLRGAGEVVTGAEVAAQRLRDQAQRGGARGDGHRRSGWSSRARASRRAAGRGAGRGAAGAAWSGWSAGASSSARSTRWRRRSTPRPWRTSRRWRAGAPIWRRRCAS